MAWKSRSFIFPLNRDEIPLVHALCRILDVRRVVAVLYNLHIHDAIHNHKPKISMENELPEFRNVLTGKMH